MAVKGSNERLRDKTWGRDACCVASASEHADRAAATERRAESRSSRHSAFLDVWRTLFERRILAQEFPVAEKSTMEIPPRSFP
jgi:hypothetical protein